MDWSPRRFLRSLVDPRRAFEDGASLRVGVGVVLVLCVVNAALASHAVAVVADETTGTTEVENPNRPADWVCERADSDDQFAHYQEACANQPETVTREYAMFARNAASGLVPVAFLAPFAVWVAVSGAVAVAMGGRSFDALGRRIDLIPILAVTGLGLLPAVIRYASRTFLVERSVTSRTLAPTSTEEARRLAVEAMTPESAAYLAVVVATFAWSAYVWRHGWRQVLDTDATRVDVVAVGAAAVLAVQGVRPVFFGADAWPYAALLFAIGLPALAAPRVLERIELFFDLIGTRGDVELKPWRVMLEQVVGLLFVLAGTVALGGLLFA